MSVETIGVLLMTYGSPATLEDMPAYLRNVRGGREAEPELVEEFRRRYRLITQERCETRSSGSFGFWCRASVRSRARATGRPCRRHSTLTTPPTTMRPPAGGSGKVKVVPGIVTNVFQLANNVIGAEAHRSR